MCLGKTPSTETTWWHVQQLGFLTLRHGHSSSCTMQQSATPSPTSKLGSKPQAQLLCVQSFPTRPSLQLPLVLEQLVLVPVLVPVLVSVPMALPVLVLVLMPVPIAKAAPTLPQELLLARPVAQALIRRHRPHTRWSDFWALMKHAPRSP